MKLFSRLSKIFFSIAHLSCYRVKLFTVFLLSVFILGQRDTYAQDSLNPEPKTIVQPQTGKVIYMFTLDQGIMPAAWRLVKKAVTNAEEMKADYIIMRLNTYGGRVDIADSISRKLLNAKPIAVVWIDHNAASAGALISISCDSIYMSDASNIGAVTVVDGASGEKMPDKYQSYMRSTMRSIAEKQGRDVCIAEAMVDERVVCEGISDSSTTLTFTTSEAIKYGYCEGVANSLDEVIKQLGLESPTIIHHRVSGVDKMIAFLLNPIVSSLLLLMIFGGIYFELQTPGIGFALFAAITGAVLFFAPNYLDGMAQNWEIILFFVGLVLLGLEIFVIPGFGITGILGISFCVISLILAMLSNDFFDFTGVRGSDILFATFQVVIVIVIIGAFALFFGTKIFETGVGRKLVLETTQDANQGYQIEVTALNALIGLNGMAVTDLRPSGKVEINGERYDATTEGNYILNGTKIKVLRLSSSTLIVDQV